MINFAQRMLRKWGYELRKFPKETASPMHIPEAEKKAIDQILKEFSASHSSQKEFNYQALRSYLTDGRMVFFYRLLDVVKNAKVTFKDKKIADVGCGMSYLLRCIAQQAPTAQLYGYDPFAEIIPLADQICPQAKHKALDIAQIEETFDIIFCTEVLEHMINPEQALDKMKNLLKPGGILILSVPDGRIDSLAAGQIHQDGSSYWGHIHFWSPESWKLFLEKQLPESNQLITGKVDAFKLYAIITLD